MIESESLFLETVGTKVAWESRVTPSDFSGSAYIFPDFLVCPYRGTGDLSWEASGCHGAFPGGSDSKESACNAGNLGLIPGSGRSSGEGNGNPVQHCCLENSMDRGTRQARVHGITKSWTQLCD